MFTISQALRVNTCLGVASGIGKPCRCLCADVPHIPLTVKGI